MERSTAKAPYGDIIGMEARETIPSPACLTSLLWNLGVVRGGGL